MICSGNVGRLIGGGGSHQLTGAEVASTTYAERQLCSGVRFVQPRCVARRIERAGAAVGNFAEDRDVPIGVADRVKGKFLHGLTSRNEPLDVSAGSWREGAIGFACSKVASAFKNANHLLLQVWAGDGEFLTRWQVEPTDVDAGVERTDGVDTDAPQASAGNVHPLSVVQ